MKRLVAGLAIIGCFALPLPVLAQEAPHLEFVRGMRERGYHELALEYLQKLQGRKQPPLPKELAEVLPLEIAKSQADVAGREKDSARRDALVQGARKSFQDFVTKNPNHPLAGDAELELGRMIFEQGKVKAHRIQTTPGLDKAEQLRLEKEARGDFEAAEKFIAASVKKLKERYDKPPPKATKPSLLNPYLKATWLLAVNRYERAMSYSDDNDPKRGEDMKGAYTALEPLAKENRDHPDGLGWLAYALQGRCDWEQDKKPEAQARFKDILAQTKNLELIGPAQRMSRYYLLLGNYRDGQGGNRKALGEARALAEAWLKDYTVHSGSPEGQHVRLMLARVLSQEFAALPEAARKAGVNQKLVDEAMKVYDSLTGSDYAALAAIEKNQILFLSGRAANRPIAELKTFDDLILRAQLETQAAAQVAEQLHKTTDEKKQEELKAELKNHYGTMMLAVRLGLALMPENVKDEDWEKALTLLHVAYLRAGYLNSEDVYRADLFRAALAAEHLARNARKPETGPKAAQAALELYLQIASTSSEPADMERVVAVAELMEKKWPQAMQTDTGRDILARTYYQQKRLPEAAALWAKVSPKNPAFPTASYLGGVTYWSLHVANSRSAKKPVTTQTRERDLAIQLLERSLKAIDPAKGSEEDKKTHVQAAVWLADIYALLGRPEDARKLIDPLADRVGKGDLPADLPPNVRPRILSLALRANVQRRDDAGLKRALVVLDIMKKAGEGGDLGGGFNQILMEMGTQLKSQIASLEQGGEAAEAQLEQTKQSFGKFLDHLNQERGKLDPSLQLWLATSYSGLNQPAKAVDILKAFQEPKAPQRPKDDKDQEEQQRFQQEQQKYQLALQNFQRSQLLLARALRLGKQFAEADKQLKDTMTKRDWARRHPEFHKERILILQDQQQYGAAIKEWTKLITSLQQFIGRGGVSADVFNESNFHLTFCRYMEARRVPDRKERDTAIRQVAQSIVTLEKSDFGGPEHRRRFEEFLNHPAHQDIKAVYDKLNGGK